MSDVAKNFANKFNKRVDDIKYKRIEKFPKIISVTKYSSDVNVDLVKNDFETDAIILMYLATESLICLKGMMAPKEVIQSFADEILSILSTKCNGNKFKKRKEILSTIIDDREYNKNGRKYNYNDIKDYYKDRINADIFQKGADELCDTLRKNPQLGLKIDESSVRIEAKLPEIAKVEQIGKYKGIQEKPFIPYNEKTPQQKIETNNKVIEALENSTTDVELKNKLINLVASKTIGTNGVYHKRIKNVIEGKLNKNTLIAFMKAQNKEAEKEKQRIHSVRLHKHKDMLHEIFNPLVR